MSFNGFEIDLTSLTGEILIVAADVSSTMAFRSVSTSNNDVFVDLGGVILEPNTTLIVDTTIGSVPEPAPSACVALILALMLPACPEKCAWFDRQFQPTGAEL